MHNQTNSNMSNLLVTAIKGLENIDKINENFEALGLLVNGKPVSFSKFKERADAHAYTRRGVKPIYIVYVGSPRENLFAFYPPRTTKAISLKIAYEYFLDTVTTDMKQEYLDGNVAWGNSGYPLSYGRIYYR
jgi:hypothetical protein